MRGAGAWVQNMRRLGRSQYLHDMPRRMGIGEWGLHDLRRRLCGLHSEWWSGDLHYLQHKLLLLNGILRDNHRMCCSIEPILRCRDNELRQLHGQLQDMLHCHHLRRMQAQLQTHKRRMHLRHRPQLLLQFPSLYLRTLQHHPRRRFGLLPRQLPGLPAKLSPLLHRNRVYGLFRWLLSVSWNVPQLQHGMSEVHRCCYLLLLQYSILAYEQWHLCLQQCP